MTEPNEYRLVLALQAAIRRLRTADGYFFDIDDDAVKLDGDEDIERLTAADGPRPFAIIEPRPESWTYSPGSVVIEQPFTVFVATDAVAAADPITGAPAPTTDADRMRTFWRLVADVERAIGVDVSLGGTCVDARITRRTWLRDIESQMVVAEIELDAKVYREYGKP